MPDRAFQLIHALRTARQLKKDDDVLVSMDSHLGSSTKIRYMRVRLGERVPDFECMWLFDNVGLVDFHILSGQPEVNDTVIIGIAAGLDLRG